MDIGLTYRIKKLSTATKDLDLRIEFPKYIDREFPISKFFTTSSTFHTYPAKIARKNPPRGKRKFDAK